MRVFFSLCLLLTISNRAVANPPVASYLFPAGGQRGTAVNVRVGGLFLYDRCGFEMLGSGVRAPAKIERMPTPFFEGPLLPLPDSQQAEDYPQDMAATLRIANDAPLGPRRARLWTAEGAASGLTFIVGDLPEIIEEEIEGDPIAVPVKLPVTINGRIFPRQNVDLWSFTAGKGQTISCAVNAASIGSPLDAALAILDERGHVVAETGDSLRKDPLLRFTAPTDGTYRVRIQDTNNKGGPAYVYRLTLTSEPYADRIYPLGGRRGERVQLRLHTGPGETEATAEVALPEKGPNDYRLRPVVAGKTLNEIALDLDDLPEFIKPDNTSPEKSNSFTVPAMLNGRIMKPGETDRWQFTGRKGETLALELRAVRLGSPLLGVLTISDATGKQLARVEGNAKDVDPTLTFTAPADGTYTIQISDRFRSRGGPAFAYRLRIAAPAPGPDDFRLRLAADTLNLPRGGKATLKIQADRTGGFNGPIALTFDELPAGVKAASATIAAGQNAVDIAFTAEATASIKAFPLTIHGTATIGDKPQTRTASLATPGGQPEIDSVLVATTLPVPFKVVADYEMNNGPCGTIVKRHYRIERGGYTGPFEVRIADRQARHLQGAHGPTLTVPAGVNEIDYPITLPPWMERGRTCRVCIMTIGTIKDGDVTHQVSFSATGQNDQLITVVETGRLSVETGKSSIAVKPGQSVSVAVNVGRTKGLTGAVKIELVLGKHIQGVKVDSLVIPADQATGRMMIHFDSDKVGPFNQAAVVRATMSEGSEFVIAESRLEFVVEEP